jgi:hypothetical protein
MIAISKSFHEKAGVSQADFSPSLREVFPFERSRLCRHPSIRTLLERFSLGASWAYSFQQVLLPDYRSRLPSL